MSNGDKELKEKVHKLVSDSLQMDQVLRDQYQMGTKFKFIRDRLTALKNQIEEDLKSAQSKLKIIKNTAAEDEIVVYVYLYNAQGLVFSTWQKMLNESVFYEYSVNRPIYMQKNEVESFIRSKSEKSQHAILAIAIKKDAALIASEDAELQKDQIGNRLIKVKEGSLSLSQMICFIYQEKEYVLNESGLLVPKDNSREKL